MAPSSTHFQDCVGDNVLIFTRWLLKGFKKEQAVLTNYERSHPHFLGYLALDALLSVALVFAGFQIYESNFSHSGALIHVGDVLMSSAQLSDHLKKDGIEGYWMGSIQGAEYTVNHTTAGIVDVMYLPKGTDASDDKAFIYEVKTYKSQEVWDSHTHPILATSDTTVIPLDQNISIKINKSSMKGVIVTYADKPVIVAIAYPKAQSINVMKKNVENLKLIR